MMHASPPRRAEALLEATGANSEFREAVLGDLAEEFALRAGWDGPAVARRWYYRESLRVLPFLVRDWWRRARARDVARVAGAVAFASIATMTVEYGLQLAYIRAFARPASDAAPEPILGLPFGHVILPVLMLLWTKGDGVIAGWLAARVSRRAPVPAVAALGALWVAAMAARAIAIHAIADARIPVWFTAVNAVMLVGGIAGGGFLAASRARSLTPFR